MATTRRVKTAYPPFLRIAGFERDFAGLSFSAREGDAPLWDDLTISAAGATRGILRKGDTERFEYIEASTAVSLVRHKKEGGGFDFEAMPGDAAENGQAPFSFGPTLLTIADGLLLFAIEGSNDYANHTQLKAICEPIVDELGRGSRVFLAGVIPLDAIAAMEVDSGKSGDLHLFVASTCRPDGTEATEVGDVGVTVGFGMRPIKRQMVCTDGVCKPDGPKAKLDLQGMAEWLRTAVDGAASSPGVRKATPVGHAVHWELGDITDLLPAAP